MTATVGMAISSVFFASASYWARRCRRVIAPVTTSTTTTTKRKKNSRVFLRGVCVSSARCIKCAFPWQPSDRWPDKIRMPANSLKRLLRRKVNAAAAFAPAVNHGENAGHEKERREGRENQPADDRTAERGVLLAALAKTDGHRHHADNHRESGHQNGAYADKARFESRVAGVLSFRHLLAGKGNHEDAVGGGDAHAHDGAGQRGNVQGGPGNEKNPANARKGAGKSGDDNEGIEPGLKIHDDEQVGENDSADQAVAESGERRLHRGDLAANNDVAAARKLALNRGDTFFHRVGDRAEVAAVNGGINVDHGLDSIVRDFGGAGGGSRGDEIPKNLRIRAGNAAADSGVLKCGKRIHAVLRGLNGDLVADAVFWIEPKRGGGLKAGTQGDQHVLRNVAGLQADRLRARTVHIHVQRRFVESLLNVNVGGAGNVSNFVGQFLRDGVVTGLVGSQELDVDGSRRPEIENLRDDVGGLKEKLDAGEAVRQGLAKFFDVVAGGPAALGLELNEDFGVAGADGAGIAVAQVDAAVRQTDVVEHRDNLFSRNGLANHLVDFIGEARGFFNPQAGARAHVQANLAGIDGRKEVAAEKETQAS